MMPAPFTLVVMKGAGGWMGTTEAAERLGIVPRTLYRLLDEGKIPAYKLGRVIRIEVDDLDAFLEEHRVPPGTLGHLYPPPGPRGDAAGEQDDDEDVED